MFVKKLPHIALCYRSCSPLFFTLEKKIHKDRRAPDPPNAVTYSNIIPSHHCIHAGHIVVVQFKVGKEHIISYKTKNTKEA
jgi:hypothetical protein